jgi:4-amino-4-deoxy-L-arabinose transferase-like glycosyltransferase
MSLTLQTSHIKNEIATLAGKSWMQYVWLVVITLFAAALRIYRLGEWSFWIDEIFTIDHAVSHFSTTELLLKNIPPSRNWIPISVIVNAQVLNLGGINEWSARLTPAIIGILTIPILYFPTRKIFGPIIALISVLLLAVSPWHLFWSQNARFYSSLMLFYTLALFAFHLGIEEDKPGYLLVFFLLVYLAASERLSALFIFPVVVTYLATLWILKFDKPKGMNFRNLLIITLPLLIGGAIELYSRIVNGESRFFADFNWFLQYQIDDPFRLLVFVGNNFGIPLMMMALFSGLFLLSVRSRPGLLMLVSATVPLVILLLANLFIFTKDRYVFITLFSWIILAVVGINEIASWLQGNSRWLAIAVFFVLFAYALNDILLYYQVNHGDRLPWKSAFSSVEERAREQDVIVAFWPEFHPFYTDQPISAYEALDLKSMLASQQRYWFVLDSETIWTNGDVKTWLEGNAELIDVWYLRRPENNFLRVYLFDPARSPEP